MCLFFVQPHRCDQCPLSFNIEFNLTLHKSTHNGDDPMCPACNKKFSRVASLKAHIMLHEKEEVTTNGFLTVIYALDENIICCNWMRIICCFFTQTLFKNTCSSMSTQTHSLLYGNDWCGHVGCQIFS